MDWMKQDAKNPVANYDADGKKQHVSWKLTPDANGQIFNESSNLKWKRTELKEKHYLMWHNDHWVIWYKMDRKGF